MAPQLMTRKGLSFRSLQRWMARAKSSLPVPVCPVMSALARDGAIRRASSDVTYSFKVLAHVPEIELALAEMARVTRPGGVVLAEFYNPWSIRYLAKRLGPARAISKNTTEAAVYTRFDSPRRIKEILPRTVRLEGFRGVRVLTPTARLVSLPILGPALQAAEHALLDSPAATLGGFLIAVARRV